MTAIGVFEEHRGELKGLADAALSHSRGPRGHTW
jgi:hypothetical protein